MKGEYRVPPSMCLPKTRWALTTCVSSIWGTQQIIRFLWVDQYRGVTAFVSFAFETHHVGVQYLQIVRSLINQSE